MVYDASGRSKGCAFAYFRTFADVQTALRECDGEVLNGMAVKLHPMSSRDAMDKRLGAKRVALDDRLGKRNLDDRLGGKAGSIDDRLGRKKGSYNAHGANNEVSKKSGISKEARLAKQTKRQKPKTSIELDNDMDSV